ncbi:MAG: rRNA maturation RNase YbeY [Candidatus Cloacimonadales bacterium]
MIKIIIDNQTEQSFDQQLFQQVLTAMQPENISHAAEVNLLLTADNTIAELNKRYRGKAGKTDVLSFSSQIPGLPFLGDIIIDISVAENQKGNHSLAKEVQLLFLHGMLHLLGYDHISVAQKKSMQQKEKLYQNNLDKIIGE